MKTLARFGAPALAATALLATTVAPAQAERLVRHDATTDVTVCYGGGNEGEACVRDRGRTESDLSALVTNHTATTVYVQARFQKLVDYRTQPRSLFVPIGTDEGGHYAVSAHWYRGEQHAYVLGESRDDTCPGLRVTADYTNATITAAVPRSCLSYPSWVRTTATYRREADDVTIADHANTGYVDQISGPDIYGPTVAKG